MVRRIECAVSSSASKPAATEARYPGLGRSQTSRIALWPALGQLHRHDASPAVANDLEARGLARQEALRDDADHVARPANGRPVDRDDDVAAGTNDLPVEPNLLVPRAEPGVVGGGAVLDLLDEGAAQSRVP